MTDTLPAIEPFTCTPHGNSVRPGEDWTKDQCRPCWVAARKALNLAVTRPPSPSKPPPQPAPRRFLPLNCLHLGPETGETRPCTTCGGKSKLEPLRSCAIHGTCTDSRLVKTESGEPIPCCGICNDKRYRAGFSPASPPTVRNLAYHLLPVSGRWKQAMSEVVRRWGLFNGRKVIAVAAGTSTRRTHGNDPERTFALDSVDDVRAYLPADAEVVEVPNDPNLREVATFLPLFEPLQTDDPEQCIFYAHSKGVTQAPDATSMRWAAIAYESCLDYWPLVAEVLAKHPIAGSFKKVGHWFGGSSSDWHYSGSFFWTRSDALFSRQWRNIEHVWFGVETYPSVQFEPRDAGCLFYQSDKQMNLYNHVFLNGEIENHFAGWKKSTARYRAECKPAPTSESLNVGCGPFYVKGWFNTDVVTTDLIRPDMVVPYGGSMPFADGQFSRAYLGHVIEHIPWERVAPFLADVRRVVRPGGQVCIVGPDVKRAIGRFVANREADPIRIWKAWEDFQHYQVGEEANDWPGARHHWNCYAERVAVAMKAAGFVDVAELPFDAEHMPGWPVVDFSDRAQFSVIGTVP